MRYLDLAANGFTSIHFTLYRVKVCVPSSTFPAI